MSKKSSDTSWSKVANRHSDVGATDTVGNVVGAEVGTEVGTKALGTGVTLGTGEMLGTGEIVGTGTGIRAQLSICAYHRLRLAQSYVGKQMDTTALTSCNAAIPMHNIKSIRAMHVHAPMIIHGTSSESALRARNIK